jgi:PEP-CTERM motif
VRIHRFAYGVAAIALLGFGATTARATSRAGVGTTGPGSPPCSTFPISVTESGTIISVDNQCTEGVNTVSIEVIGTAPLELYSPLLEVPTVDDSGKGLSELGANLLLLSTGTTLEWTQTCGADGADFECTLTAPTPNAYDLGVLGVLAKAGITNDGDCDRDDTILFVPAGCDLFFTTGAIGNLPGDSKQAGDFLNPNEVVTSESFGVPEPGTVALLLAGMVGLFAFRRKYAL